jgi:ADP-heptose:LPS heptosyltransferase/GT2 family glycosyltransferase
MDDLRAPVLRLEAPLAGAAVVPGEKLTGYGWIAGVGRVHAIIVFFGDTRMCAAATGLSRNDVEDEEALGRRPEGFAFTGTVPAMPPGPAELRVVAQTASGETRAAVMLNVGGAASAPIATRADAPLVLRVEDAILSPSELLVVRGWAVSLSPVQRVEVFGPDGLLGVARLGLPREDIAAAYPTYADADRAGFRLDQRVDASALLGAELRVVVHALGLPPRLSVIPVTQEAIAPLAEPEPLAPSEPALAPMLLRLEECKVNEEAVLRVRGWTVGLAPIDEIRVYLEDRLLGVAQKGVPRGDVAAVHPDYPDSAHSGFLLLHRLDEAAVTGQTVRVVSRMFGGIAREARATLEMLANVRRSGPQAAEVHLHCDAVTLTEDGAVSLTGWAVCAAGLVEIAVELAGQHVGLCETGRDRPDVGNHFPQIPAARSSGFYFAGRAETRVSGEQIVRVIARGGDGAEKITLLPVLAMPAADAPLVGDDGGNGIRFYLDTPQYAAGPDGNVASETVRGFMSIAGWALAPAGIAGVEVLVDGTSLGEAYYGIRREDIGNAFPGMDNALLCGFAMLVPPQVLRRGRHAVRVIVRDKAGTSTQVDFAVDAEPATGTDGPWQLRRKMTDGERRLLLSIIEAGGPCPAFRLVMRLDNTKPATLDRARATIASLRRQVYPFWRLLVPAGAEAASVLLDGNEDLADRLDVAALPTAWPEPGWGGVLSPGDELGVDALIELAAATRRHPRAELLYADERRVDPADGEMKAYFKPDWSPDLLLSTNYIGRLWVARTALLDRCDLTPDQLAWASEYGMVLQLTECSAGVAHVPHVLCERARTTLEASAQERGALRVALERRGIRARVTPGCLPGVHRVQRRVATKGMVSIIIPTVATRGLVQVCIDSIRQKSTWRNFEIVVLDNIPEDNVIWRRWVAENADVVVRIEEKFNWSRFNNLGVAQSSGEFLLFLNDDIEVLDTHADWLECLLEHAQRPEVGVVGPQLLYPDGKVQHAGMFLAEGVARHAFRFSPRDEPGSFGLALTQRNVISVTGACYMVRRDWFEDLGGFDETHSVINNDLDFCLRCHRAGRAVIYTPHTTLIHHEMVSRAKIRDIYDASRFAAAWRATFLRGDPYFSPHLSIDYDDYVPEAEPVRVLHVGHPIIEAARVRRLLVVKLDHIGDFIAAIPAMRRLKALFPNAELHVLAARASQSLAALEPAIDRMHEFNFFHAKSSEGQLKVMQQELQDLRARLAPFHFDLAIDLRRQGDTRDVLRHTGATWLAGFDQRNQFPYLDIAIDWEGDIARTSKRLHVSDSLLQCVESIAVSCGVDRAVIPDFMTLAEARTVISALPAVAPMLPELFARRLVCVHPGAGNENKQWPTESFAGLIDLLVECDDANIVMIGGPDELEVAQQVFDDVLHQERVFMLVGKTSLRDLPKVLRACDLYVGNDSGPKHMAAAIGVPTIGIHSGSVDAGEWGPMGPSALALRRDMTCSPCYLSRLSDCHRNLACMRGLRPGDVHRACQTLLGLSGASSDISI